MGYQCVGRQIPRKYLGMFQAVPFIRNAVCDIRRDKMVVRIVILGILALFVILRLRGTVAVTAQEEQMKQLMKQLEEKYEVECRNKQIAYWNYWTSMTKENKREKDNAEQKYLRFQKAAFNKITRQNWRNLTDSVLRRKFRILSMVGDIALPEDKYNKLSSLLTDMQNIYNNATVCDFRNPEKCDITLEKGLSRIMATSRNDLELLHMWQSWRRQTGNYMKQNYIDMIKLSNEAAKYNGFANTTQYWLAMYEVPGFAAEMEAVWKEVRPLYQQLHMYVRKKLNQVYGSQVSRTGPIPAHLLGDIWAKDWSNLKDLLLKQNTSIPDVTEAMKEKGYTQEMIFRKAEEFFVSLRWPTMDSKNSKFWNESMFIKPENREVDCTPRAVDFCNGEDFRLKICSEVSQEDFIEAHRMLSHIQYFIHYSQLPFTFRKFRPEANPAFHLALEGLVELSVSTPNHLQAVNLLKMSPRSQAEDIDQLLFRALKIIPFLSYAYVADLWRWRLFSGDIKIGEMNKKWLEMREKYQGLKCPTENAADSFDPGAEFQIAANVPFIRYFVGDIVQFQLLKVLCTEYPEKPLHMCDLMGNEEAGSKLAEMLILGSSKQWPEVLKLVTGNNQVDAIPLLEYFLPLLNFLQEENAKTDEVIGWEGRKDAPHSSVAVIIGCMMATLVTAVLLFFVIGRRKSRRRIGDKSYIALNTNTKIIPSLS